MRFFLARWLRWGRWLALAHNQYYYSNALEFYNGPWSAMAISRRQLAGGMMPYPGDHDWHKAWAYYFAEPRICAGPVVVGGRGWSGGGFGAARRSGRCSSWPSLRCFTSGACILPARLCFVPDLWPFQLVQHSLRGCRDPSGSISPLAYHVSGQTVGRSDGRDRATISVAGSGLLLRVLIRPFLEGVPGEFGSAPRRDTSSRGVFATKLPAAGHPVFFWRYWAIQETSRPIREVLHDGNRRNFPRNGIWR